MGAVPLAGDVEHQDSVPRRARHHEHIAGRDVGGGDAADLLRKRASARVHEQVGEPRLEVCVVVARAAPGPSVSIRSERTELTSTSRCPAVAKAAMSLPSP